MPSTWREAIHRLLDETPARGLVHYVDLAAALGERWPYRFGPTPGRRTPQASVWRELNGDASFRACGGGLFRYEPWGEAGESPVRLSRDGGEGLRASTAELRGARQSAGPAVLEALLDDPTRRAEEVARRAGAMAEARALLRGRPLDAPGVLALMRLWSTTGGARPGRAAYNRFAPSFVGTFPATYAEHAAAFDEWVRELVEAPPEQLAAALDRLWARNDLPLAGKLLPSMILHTLAPSEHFPWTNRLGAGLRAVGLGAPGGETNGAAYLRYAEGVRAYVRRQGLDPHLADAALAREAARAEEREPAAGAAEWEALAAFPATSFLLLRDVAAEGGGREEVAGARRGGAYRRAVREPLEQLARVVAARVIEPLLNAPNVLGGWAVETEPARVIGRVRAPAAGGATGGEVRPYLSATFYPRAQGRRQQAVKLFLLVHAEGLDVGLSLDGAPESARERLRHALDVAGPRLVAHQRLSPLWGRLVARGLRPEGGGRAGERPVRSLDELRAFGADAGASVLALPFGAEEAGRREIADWSAEAARVLAPLFALAVSDAPDEVLDAMGVARGVEELWRASERRPGTAGGAGGRAGRDDGDDGDHGDDGDGGDGPAPGGGGGVRGAVGPAAGGEARPEGGGDEARDEFDAPPAYGREELQRDTGLPAPWLERVVRAARVGEGRDELGQVVLYGPPGTGKTFIAERVALHLADGDRGRVELVQFHPAFGYEHFVEGYRPEVGPDGNSLLFQRADGVLLDLVARVARTGRRHVLLIDEINRGDLPHIFGELMYLLARRREQASVRLARSRRPLSLPHCLSIVATMNVADRSVAHVDFALRRRFAFFEVAPSPQILTERLLAEGVDEVTAGALGDLLGEVNRRLAAEPPGGLELGHAYFFGVRTRDELRATWEREVWPLLEDYFDYQPERLAPYRWPHVGALFASFVAARGGDDDGEGEGDDGGAP